MKKSAVQINAQEYFELDYLDKPRWISYWHQISEVAKTQPTTVLEIGVGNGLITSVLKNLGYQVTTLDIDKKVKPTVVGDVRKLPFERNTFDTALCAQVLEHLPFEDFNKSLTQLYRVTKKYLILTLPHDFLTYFLLTIKIIPYVKPLTFFKVLGRSQEHFFNGQHYWEIGKRGFSLQKIIKEINASGFILQHTFCLPENPYHRFFILKKPL